MYSISIVWKLVPAIFTAFLLSSCGGGSSNVSFSTLQVFSNEQGIARGVNADGKQVLVYSPYIADVVAGANASNGGSTNVLASDFPITFNDGQTTIRSGTFSSGGITLNVRLLEDNNTANASAAFIEVPGEVDMTMVGGDRYSNPPATGIYRYFGTQNSYSRSTVAPGSIGSFAMDVNFTSQTFAYAGASGTISVQGEGVLDKTNGRFASSNMGISAGSSNYTGTMHGLLHGSGATSTSGIFFTNDSSPDYAGAFVGRR